MAVIILKYTFRNITEPEIYDSCQVMFVTGPYNIFNNIVIDELKSRSESVDDYDENTGLLSEFGIDVNSKDEIKISNSVNLETFLDVVDMPNVNGKWFCSVDLATMSKKHKDIIKNYIKKPSSNGILVIYANEYKDYREYLRNRTLVNSPVSHIIQLSFPNRGILTQIVEQLFKQRRVEVGIKATELFVMRLSTSYDDYEETIDRLCLGRENTELTYDEMLEGLKGVENFVLDDLIERLLIPVPNNSTSANKKMYRMLSSLIQEFGPEKLVNRLKYKINDYIEFRIAINSGIIPIKVRYSVLEAKGRLGEDSRIAKINDYQFRRMAYIASKTSLRDWTYMRLILNNVTSRYRPESYEKVLYSLVNRSNLSEFRLNNDVGIIDIISPDLDKLNKTIYTEPANIQNLLESRAMKRLADDLTEDTIG